MKTMNIYAFAFAALATLLAGCVGEVSWDEAGQEGYFCDGLKCDDSYTFAGVKNWVPVGGFVTVPVSERDTLIARPSQGVTILGKRNEKVVTFDLPGIYRLSATTGGSAWIRVSDQPPPFDFLTAKPRAQLERSANGRIRRARYRRKWRGRGPNTD